MPTCYEKSIPLSKQKNGGGFIFSCPRCNMVMPDTIRRHVTTAYSQFKGLPQFSKEGKRRTTKKRLEILAALTSYYIEGRYPSYKMKLSKAVDKKKSMETLTTSEEIYKWLKSKIQRKKP